MTNIPQSRPQRTRAAIEALVAGKIPAGAQVYLVGIRGYYKNSMGKPGENDRGIYDDAFFVVSPRTFAAFNGNTDPSRHGFNEKAGKGMAVLQAGVWVYRRGLHGVSRNNPYPAFVQAGAATVLRDGGKKEQGFFAINIHKGGVNTTSSEGCQTVPPAQWDEFYRTLTDELSFYGQQTFPYLLCEEP
jgi:lysozyme